MDHVRGLRYATRPPLNLTLKARYAWLTRVRPARLLRRFPRRAAEEAPRGGHAAGNRAGAAVRTGAPPPARPPAARGERPRHRRLRRPPAHDRPAGAHLLRRPDDRLERKAPFQRGAPQGVGAGAEHRRLLRPVSADGVRGGRARRTRSVRAGRTGAAAAGAAGGGGCQRLLPARRPARARRRRQPARHRQGGEQHQHRVHPHLARLAPALHRGRGAAQLAHDAQVRPAPARPLPQSEPPRQRHRPASGGLARRRPAGRSAARSRRRSPPHRGGQHLAGDLFGVPDGPTLAAIGARATLLSTTSDAQRPFVDVELGEDGTVALPA